MKKLIIATFFILFYNTFYIANLHSITQDEQDQNGTDKGVEIVALPTSVAQEAQNYFEYLKATYQHMKGKTLDSLQSFQKLFSDNVPVYAYEGFIRLLFDIGQFKKIIEIEKEVNNKFDDNLDVQLIFAQSFLNLGMDERAENLFKKLVKKYPNNEQVAYYTSVSYIKKGNLEQALKFIDKCLKNPAIRSKHFLFYFLASKIYLQKREYEKALNNIKKSLELYPPFDKGWLLKALLEEQLGRINQAILGYKRFLDIVGSDLAVEKQLIQLLFSASRFEEAEEILQKMERDTAEYYFDLALIEWRAGKYNKSIKNVEKSLQKSPGFRRAKLLKIEILLTQNKKDAALKFVTDWLSVATDDSSVVRILLLLRKAGVKIKSIISSLEQVISKSKESLGVLSALIDLYLEQSNYGKALSTSQRLLSLTKDAGLKSRVLFQVGYIYFVTNQHDKLERVLKDAMRYKPTYPSVYNLLAYYYALKGKKLDEALKLINMALKLRPNCYYYVDTLGYVLLKQGKIEESIAYFNKALNLSLSADKKEIVEHLKEAKLLYKKIVEKNYEK